MHPKEDRADNPQILCSAAVLFETRAEFSGRSEQPELQPFKAATDRPSVPCTKTTMYFAALGL
jgi:hypothetical protein